MILGKRSESMLKYEKTKAKLVEFDIAKEYYPQFPLDSNDLVYTTIYILSRFCEEFIESSSSARTSGLKSELSFVSQYYDTTVRTKTRYGYSNLLLLLGATSYFLSDNFGSAKVLIQLIDKWEPRDSVLSLLYVTLTYVLTGEWIDIQTKKILYREFINSMKRHFSEGSSHRIVIDVLRNLHYRIHQSTNMQAINFIDILFSVVLYAFDHSAWLILPKYSAATVEQWQGYLSKPSSLKLLWPAQKIIIHAGALTGQDLVVPLPTGVGKTKSIEILLRSKFMGTGTIVAIIIAPLRALCAEITVELTSTLADEAVINQFTDTIQMDLDLKLLFNTKYVFICTPEKFSYILRHRPDFLEDIQLFIFDEAHLFDDVSRGVQYELLVSEIARHRNETAQMVLFSAVLANSGQLSEWLFNDEKAIVDYSLLKSTEKSIGFLSSDQKLHYYEKDNMEQESFFVPKSISFSKLQLRGKEKAERVFPLINAQDIAIYYANKLCNQGGSAIYVGIIPSILPVMRRIVEIHTRGYDLSNILENSNSEEITKLSYLFELHYGQCSVLTQAARLGVYPHYSNLPNSVKLAVENAVRKKHISLIVCTTTLAEGVNIPIKYLFLTTNSLGNSKVQIRKMQNMVGRTARSGVYTEGSAIITDPKFYDNRRKWVGGGTYQWADCKRMFDYNSTEACTSAILSLVSDVPLDYNISYPANELIHYLINNYHTNDCFLRLLEKVKAYYRSQVADDIRYSRYIPEIVSKIMQLEDVFENIEAYLCFVYSSQENSQSFITSVASLANLSFAFYLGDDRQKEALVALFQQIAQKIISAVTQDKAAYFAKSLYGVDTSSQVFSWVESNFTTLENYTLEELIIESTKLFTILFPNITSIGFDTLYLVLQQWMAGNPYIDIFNSMQHQLNIGQIEKLCSSTFSYHLCFLIGNIIDAIGDRSEELVDLFSLAQKRIKYGVPSYLQILICENLFDDRIIAQQLDAILGVEILSEDELKKYMLAERKAILQLLKVYPNYFSYKFRLYIK